jgi:hypothetical protein
MKAKFLALFSILFVVAGMAAVFPVAKSNLIGARACPDDLCIINHASYDPGSPIGGLGDKMECSLSEYDCTECCAWCQNTFPEYKIVGSCYCRHAPGWNRDCPP